MKNDLRGAASVPQGTLLFDRRTGPRDRRSEARGGRRSYDVLTATVMLTGSLLGGCNASQSFTPTAPTDLSVSADTTPTQTGTPAPTGTTSAQAPATIPAGTALNPGDDIQAAVNAHPPGTTFVIKTGVHRRQTIRPKDGMTFVGEHSAVLDGEGVTQRAFIGQNTSRVTVRGLRITGYAPPNISAALDGLDSRGWVVEHNEIDHNANGSNRVYGLRLGHDMVVRNNRIHHNGWVGIDGYKATGALVEGNELYANPPARFNDTIGEAANMKCYACGSITVRNNNVHDGPFRGIWFDRSQPDITIEGNRVVNHGEAGIWYEVSYRGTIRKNYVENAGSDSYYSKGWLRGGGIQITNSPDVSVLDNTVVDSLNGIIGLQASSYYDGPYGPSQLRNLLVQGNTIVMSKGQTGIAENISSNAVFDSWNNRFLNNRYELRSNSTPFYWRGRNMTESEWKAGPGSADSFTR